MRVSAPTPTKTIARLRSSVEHLETSQPIKHAAVADMKTQRRASYVKAKKRAVGSNTKEAEVSNSLSSGIQHTNHRRSKEHFGHWSSNGGRH